MDTPTIIILCSIVASLALVVTLRLLHVARKKSLSIMLAFIGIVWLALTIFGEFIYGAGNSTCSKLLGCVEGFGGYDAFEHLFFGVVLVLAIAWLSEHFPKLSLRSDRRWKTALTFIAIVALASVLWEMGECARDAIRLDVLHEHLLNFRLHINLLEQPSNLDTMGDLTSALVGAVMGLFL